MLVNNFVLSQSLNPKKGGLIGVAAAAIALGKDIGLFVSEIVSVNCKQLNSIIIVNTFDILVKSVVLSYADARILNDNNTNFLVKNCKKHSIQVTHCVALCARALCVCAFSTNDTCRL